MRKRYRQGYDVISHTPPRVRTVDGHVRQELPSNSQGRHISGGGVPFLTDDAQQSGDVAATTWTGIDGFSNAGSDSFFRLASNSPLDLQVQAEWTVVTFFKVKAQPPAANNRLWGKNDGSPGWSHTYAALPRLQYRDQGTAVLQRAITAADVGKTFLMVSTRKTGSSGDPNVDGATLYMYDSLNNEAKSIQYDSVVVAPTIDTVRVASIGDISSFGGAAEEAVIIGCAVGNQFMTKAQMDTYMQQCVFELTASLTLPGALAVYQAKTPGTTMETDLTGNGFTMTKLENTPGDLVQVTEAPVWATV